MFKSVNIGKIFRVLLMIAAVCLLLTACSDESGSAPKKNNPLGDSQGAAPESIAAEQQNCWQSSILEMMYNQMGVYAMGMYKQICDGSMALMLLAFCIWLSFRLLRHVSSFQEENIGETWTEILKQLMLCGICGMIANSSANIIWVLNHVIFPLFYAFLEFGSEMLNVGVNAGGSASEVWFLGEKTTLEPAITCSASELAPSSEGESFPQAPLQLLSCLTCTINSRLGLGMSTVLASLTQAGFMAMIVGFLIYCIFWFVKIAFIFYIVDALFRFTIMVSLMPLLVLSYAFQKTRSLARNGFISLISSAGYMMMIAFVIAICLLALQSFIQMPELGLNIENKYAYRADLKSFSVVLICLLLMAFLCASTMSIAKELTGEFIGDAGNDNFQKQAGKLAAVIGKFAFTKLTLGLGRLLMMSGKVRKAKGKVDAVTGQIGGALNKLAGRQQGD